MSVRNTVKSIQDIMRQDVGVDGDAQRLSQLCWMFVLKIIDDQDKELYEQLLNDLQSAGNAGEYYTPRAVTAFMVDRIDPQPGKTLLDPACGTGGFLTCAIRHMRQHYVKNLKDEQKMQSALRAVEKKPLPHMLCVTNMLCRHRPHQPTLRRA